MKNLFLILMIFLFASAYAQEKYINVNGTSELILNADQINFTIQIKVINATLEEAKKNNDSYVSQLLQVLKDMGISHDDIEVSPVTLGKNYEYSGGQRIQNGFYTRTNVTFVLKDLSKYFDLTDRLTANDNFEIVSSYYSISNYEAQNKKAYELALKAAKEKAEYMCKALGISLSDVLEIDATGNAQRYPKPLNISSRENNQNENPLGKVTIQRSIRVKFAIM
jgi:uncharacterized protein YggE